LIPGGGNPNGLHASKGFAEIPVLGSSWKILKILRLDPDCGFPCAEIVRRRALLLTAVY